MTAATTRRNVVRTKSSESIVCYNCRGLNQIAKNCATPQEECSVFQMRRDGTRGVKMYKAARKRGGERSVCASSLSNTRGLSALVVIQIKVNGKYARAIVDTGCSTTFVFQNLVSSDQLERASDVKVTTFGGEVQKCDGTATVSLEVGNVCTRDHVLVASIRLFGADYMLRMSSIRMLGGLTILPSGKARFGGNVCTIVKNEERIRLEIKKRDHEAVFNGVDWTVKWIWKNEDDPKISSNTVAHYAVPDDVKQEYESELREWIKQGWLLEYDEHTIGPPKGQLPLMVVVQRNKNKVRTVLDWRETKRFIEAFTRDSDVCAEKLRQWRRMDNCTAIIDLRKAYLGRIKQ